MFARARKLSFPILTRLEEEMNALQVLIEEKQRTLNQVSLEYQQSTAAVAGLTNLDEMTEASRARVRLRYEAEQIQREIKSAEARLEDCAAEFRQWTETFDNLLSRKESLFRELGESQDQERMAAVREALLPVLKNLAKASGDEKTLREVATIEAEIEATQSFWVCDRPLYFNANKTQVVEENDPQAKTTAFGRGVRVDKTEARRWGLIPKEAA